MTKISLFYHFFYLDRSHEDISYIKIISNFIYKWIIPILLMQLSLHTDDKPIS